MCLGRRIVDGSSLRAQGKDEGGPSGMRRIIAVTCAHVILVIDCARMGTGALWQV